MALLFDAKGFFSQPTECVKGADLHPTEPWLLTNLYNGNVYIWNRTDSTMVKSFKVADLPVRAAKFVARKQWVVCGSDDLHIKVYNYDTMARLKTFKAHSDCIRCISIHPTLPYALTSSDDMLIKLWDWDQDWLCTQVFKGHAHYVMQVAFNPKDTNTFASASLDRTIQVWTMGQPTPNFTLEGHEKGVSAVDYFTAGDRPYLVSGGDDKLVKVWDLQTKACVRTLEGHSHRITAVGFHPAFSALLSGSEDGTIKVWHARTHQLRNTYNSGLGCVSSIGIVRGSASVALGCDHGARVVKMAGEGPLAAMENLGKIMQ